MVCSPGTRSDGVAASRPERCGGVTITEMLVLTAILGIVLLTGMAGWQTYRRKTDISSAARTLKTTIHKARMLSVYRRVNYFVVINPAANTVAIHEDSHAPVGKFDSGDPRISFEALPSSVRMQLPAQPSPLANPLGGSALSDAWSLPLPDTSAAWGSGLRGVMTVPSGRVQSGEATPATIASGVVVFSDNTGRTSSVGLRGQAGSVRAFELLDSGWKEL